MAPVITTLGLAGCGVTGELIGWLLDFLKIYEVNINNVGIVITAPAQCEYNTVHIPTPNIII